MKPSPIHPSSCLTNSRARVILRTKDILCCCHLLIVEPWLITTELVYEPPEGGQLCAPPGAGALCSSQRKVSTVVTNIAMNDSKCDVYQDCSHVSSARIEEGDCTATSRLNMYLYVCVCNFTRWTDTTYVHELISDTW